MNTTIRRGAILSLLLIVALLVHFTVVQGFREEEYAQDSRNSRTFMELKQVNRGQINAGGQVLAESYRDEATGFYQRAYPNMPYSFGPVVGYVSDQFGTSQLESTFNAELNGDGKGSNSRFTRTGLEQDRVGNTVELSLDPNLQAFAYEQLSNNNYDGAIVALRPSSGQVLAMASTPSFDPNSISSPATAAEAWGQLNNDPKQPLLNHAAQDQLPPGSIFKIITTVAGLRSGYTPDSPLTGDAQIILPGTNVPLTNFGGQACAGGGQVTLTTAFALSCNTAFVQMALNMGADPLRKAAADFGVGERYDLMELGVPNAAGSLGDIPGAAELGQSAIGQRDVTMTALQAAGGQRGQAHAPIRGQPRGHLGPAHGQRDQAEAARGSAHPGGGRHADQPHVRLRARYLGLRRQRLCLQDGHRRARRGRGPARVVRRFRPGQGRGRGRGGEKWRALWLLGHRRAGLRQSGSRGLARGAGCAGGWGVGTMMGTRGVDKHEADEGHER